MLASLAPPLPYDQVLIQVFHVPNPTGDFAGNGANILYQEESLHSQPKPLSSADMPWTLQPGVH